MINAFEDTGNLPNINIIERAEKFSSQINV